MRLGGRIAAAIEIIGDIRSRNRPASEALKDWGLSHRFAGSGDRNAIGNMVYDTLRRLSSQAWLAGSEEPAPLVFATLLRQWGHAPGELSRQFDGDRFAPELPPEAELERLASATLEGAPDHVRADLPEWLMPHFQAAFGDRWIIEGEALAVRPPLDLRVNRLKASRDKVLRQLARSGAKPGDIAVDAIRIAPGERDSRLPNIQVEEGYRKGWFEVQDEGSQLCALMTAASPGEQVLDFCAGAGGKTLALAAMMGNRGQIHAHDSDKSRLAPIHERLVRAGTRNVQVHAPGSDLSRLSGSMDLVLVDAPCTGSGTWRRRPETKWKLNPAGMEARCAEQIAVLDQAAGFVRPGGRLAYITCSLLDPENLGQAHAFLERHPAFEPITPALSGIFADGGPQPLQREGTVTLSPARTGTDGFFLAMFRRKPI